MPNHPTTEGECEHASTDPFSMGGIPLVGASVSLVLHHRDGAEVAVLHVDRPIVVGRSSSADLRAPDRSLSRRHARFTLRDGIILVEDLGSTNGVRIAGERVSGAVITPGTGVGLGNVTVRAHALDPASSAGAWGARPSVAGGVRAAVGAAMREVHEAALRVARSRIPVILHGETGTGKEVLARIIHENGPRRERRMVRVNCGAIPAQLVESTLFGHEKGAFTGAVHQQRGVFEEADKSTVLLDEIGELPLAAQAALLRVLETGSFARVGSTREVESDVRVIAATHRDLESMVAQRTFREDLYYRLCTMVIEVPPLRARPDEIEALALHFLDLANTANRGSVRGISSAAFQVMLRYRWPGNVRELKNTIERAAVVAQGALIQPEDLPARLRVADTGAGLPSEAPPRAAADDPRAVLPPVLGEVRTQVKHYEAQMLEDALRKTGWNRAEAAKRLGMPVRTLSYRIKVLGLVAPTRQGIGRGS